MIGKLTGRVDQVSLNAVIVDVGGVGYEVTVGARTLTMSCPCHVQIFKQGLKSYRDLPLKYAEFGCVHRNELTGAMYRAG